MDAAPQNAICHTAFLTTEFLPKKLILAFQQFPYSLDLSLCNFFLFLKNFKNVLKGRRFGTEYNIQKNCNILPKKHFQLQSLGTDMKNGKNVFDTAWLPMKITQKEIDLMCNLIT